MLCTDNESGSCFSFHENKWDKNKNVIFENKRRRLARAFVYVREIDIGSGLDMSSELLGFSPCFAHLEKKLYSTRHILSLF